MSGAKILLLLLLSTIAVVIYVLTPNREALDRRDKELSVYREATHQALAESTELIRHFNRLKPSQKKKKEIGEIRRNQESLDRKAKALLEDEDLEATEAARGLEDLTGQYFDLKRDAEDLLARLRDMKAYKDRLDPLASKSGLLQSRLAKLSAKSADPEFARRVNHLFDKARIARTIAGDGQQALSTSIVEGRPLCESAINMLTLVNKDMNELVELEESRPQPADGSPP